MKRILFSYGALGIWMVMIFLLSNEVAVSSSERSDFIVEIVSQGVSLSENILTFLARKAAHIFMYFVLGILIFNIARQHTLARRAVWISIALALTYAILDEIHQLFVPGRSGELRDVLIDTTAAMAGIAAYYTVYKIRFNGLNSKNTI